MSLKMATKTLQKPAQIQNEEMVFQTKLIS